MGVVPPVGRASRSHAPIVAKSDPVRRPPSVSKRQIHLEDRYVVGFLQMVNDYLPNGYQVYEV